jgi:hypothetical protein
MINNASAECTTSIFKVEDGDDFFLRITENHLQDYTVL